MGFQERYSRDGPRLPHRLICALVLCLSLWAAPALAAKVAVETGARLLPTMAYLVGTYDGEGRPDACIIDRAGIAETTPGKMVFFIGVQPSRQTAKNIETSKAFTVNVPSAAVMPQADWCGNVSAASGDQYFDKFAVTGLKLERSSEVNAPVLTDCPVVFECKLVKTQDFPGGQHRVFYGAVVSYRVESSALEGEKNKPTSQYDAIAADTPVYFAGGAERSGYYALSELKGKRRGVWQQKFPWPNGLEPQPKKGH